MKGQLQAGVLVLALAAPLAGAAQDSSARPDPSKFPARASYQGVTIAAVPIPDTPAAERIFGPRAAPTRADIFTSTCGANPLIWQAAACTCRA